jgi:hypothetical protein
MPRPSRAPAATSAAHKKAGRRWVMGGAPLIKVCSVERIRQT